MVLAMSLAFRTNKWTCCKDCISVYDILSKVSLNKALNSELYWVIQFLFVPTNSVAMRWLAWGGRVSHLELRVAVIAANNLTNYSMPGSKPPILYKKRLL